MIRWQIIVKLGKTMTQEELDALMSQDFEAGAIDEDTDQEVDDKDFRVSTRDQWPPPPPTTEHKVVHQLDEVTKETEEKSSQIFDILEAISNDSTEAESTATKLKKDIDSIKDTFTKLNTHFPAIKTFKAHLDQIGEIENLILHLERVAVSTNDQVMVAMDIMQFQDIHRQKIERVINVMRALTRYMNSLFASDRTDESRVSSAVHIAGDNTEDVVGEDDIEALIAAFGGKK